MNMTTRERQGWAVAAAVAVLMLGSATVGDAKSANSGKGNASERRQLRKLSGAVQREAKRGKGSDRINVIVRFNRVPGAAESQLLTRLGGLAKRKNPRIAGQWLSLRLPKSAVDVLAENPNVDFIATDAPVASMMDVAKATAGRPSPLAPEVQLTGAGVTVAVVDSGVSAHPEIGTLIAAADFVGTQGQPGQGSFQLLPGDPLPSPQSIDPNGHGTHVAGIVVGNGSHSGGRYAGVAPGASLVSVRVLDGEGRGQTSDVIAGLEWVVANKDVLGIRVLNLSLGHQIFEPAASDPLVQAVEAVWNSGIVVVCSAGNLGRSGNGTVTSPCNSPKVITVGAANDHNTADTADDGIATYSSRGPSRFDLLAKPDLLAPGNKIVSLRAAGSTLDLEFPARRIEGDLLQPGLIEHYEMSGTSMASPMVAGAAALMLEQEPWLTPATVKARLMLSARKPATGNPLGTGAGVLDIMAALGTTGDVAVSPSPGLIPDPETGRMGFQNTAVTWGNEAFALAALWSPSVVWSDATEWNQAVIWSDGCLWPDSLMWPDESMSAQSLMWPDSTLWSEGVLWPDDEIGGGYYDDAGAQQTLVDDPS